MISNVLENFLGEMLEEIANDPTDGSVVKVKDVFVKFGEDVAQLSPSELNDRGVLCFLEHSPSDEVLSPFVANILSHIINQESMEADYTKATVTFTFEKPLTLRMDDFSGVGKAFGKTVDIETSEDFKTVKSYKSYWEYEPVKMESTSTATSIGSLISSISCGTAMARGYIAAFIQEDGKIHGSDVLPLSVPFIETFFDDDKFLLDMVDSTSKQALKQRPELDLSKVLFTILFKNPMELLTHTSYAGGNKADMVHICAQSNEAGEYRIVHKFFVNLTELDDMEDLFSGKAFQ